MTKYKVTRFNVAKTAHLVELREAANITSVQALKFFGKKDRETVRNWELGHTRPNEKQDRLRFIQYLAEELKLRHNRQILEEIWHDVVMGEWKWSALQPDELRKYFSDIDVDIKPVTPEFIRKPILLAPPPLSHSLIGRGNLLRKLRHRLLTGKHLVLSGMPGVGKTALAIELANDLFVRKHFHDGVLWARLGRKANVLGE
ncbi:MAG: ATP-binding protein, partial [Bdellovibrionales bacterium]|nr:ATP-binding protein [Bdellovibrionales bacterium]